MPTSLKSIYSAGGRIKSIQRGTTVAQQGGGSVSVTISAVNMAKSFILSTYTYSSGANGVVGVGQASLSNSTTVSVSAGGNSAGGNVSVSWQVVEYE